MHLDVITYNTLIKGYCHAGVLRTAKAYMENMAGHGIKTNGMAFNGLVNPCAHAGGGNFREAWATMEASKWPQYPRHHVEGHEARQQSRGRCPCAGATGPGNIYVWWDMAQYCAGDMHAHLETRRLEKEINQFSGDRRMQHALAGRRHGDRVH